MSIEPGFFPKGESLGLNLCDTEALLSPEEYEALKRDLASLALQRRLDAGEAMNDPNKVV